MVDLKWMDDKAMGQKGHIMSIFITRFVGGNSNFGHIKTFQRSFYPFQAMNFSINN